MQGTEPTPESLTRLARTLSAVARLPAVATCDWCERTGQCLRHVHPAPIIRVLVAEVDDAGAVHDVESDGLVLASPDHAAPVAAPSFPGVLGWWWPSPTSRGAALLATLGVHAAWAASKAGRAWMKLGVTELLVASVTLADDRPSRRLVLEMAAAIGSRPLDNTDSALVFGALEALRDRALAAFGVQPINPADRITERETEVLELVVMGRTVKQIAEELSRSPHTIHDHIKNLHRKLGANTRGELVARVLGHAAPLTGTSSADRLGE